MDDTLDALGDSRRRKLLLSLLDATDREEIGVTHAADDREGDGIDSRVLLKHVYFPKLATYGIIEWNKETDDVSKGPAFDDVKPLLELLVAHEDELPDDWLATDD